MSISQDWWDAWWEEDYSWEGLAKKRWLGWYLDKAWVEGLPFEPVPKDGRDKGVAYRTATLQDYWRCAGCADDLHPMPNSDKHFTIMHLPPIWPDGSATAKHDPTAPPKTLLALLRSELARPIRETIFDQTGSLIGPDYRAQWQGAVLPELSLTHLSSQTPDQDDRIPISLIATRVAFSGKADFNRAAFSRNASFNSAAFSSRANFDGAAFSGDANFYDAKFYGDNIFEHANFRRAAFSSNANFNKVAFCNMADFADAAFSGSTAFNSAAFSGLVYFSNAAFCGTADFKRTAFSRKTYFSGAAFSGHADFNGAAFSEKAFFTGATFLSNAIFSGKGHSVTSEAVKAEIKPIENGQGALAYRQGEAVSWTAQRSFPYVQFIDATFMGAARFDNRDFHGTTSFDGARFFREAEFHGSALHRGILFTQTSFDLALTPDKRQADALPSEALERLHKTAVLSTPKDEQPSLEAWAEARFDKIAKEDDALKSETDPARNRYFERVEEGFRTLKHAMEDRRNPGQEARFFKLELLARRQRRDEYVQLPERLVSDAYRWVSDYGTSFVQPLILLFLILIPSFALAYWLMLNWFIYIPTPNSFGDSLAFSFGRVLPFGPWADADSCSALGQMLDPLNSVEREACAKVDGFEYRVFHTGTPIGVRLLASVQSVVALVLVFLSGLAIRRRFQIS